MRPAERLLDLLRAAGRPYTLLEHPPARTAREAALARGTPLGLGGKSLVMKIEKVGLTVLAVGSDRRVEGRALRHALHVQRYRFLSGEELTALTGLAPGEVPPFGRPLFDAELVVGEDLLAREEIVFAAADQTRSVRMRMEDWIAVAQPRVVAPFTVADEGA